MTYSRRFVGVLLIALMLVPQILSRAQAANAIAIDGSNIVSQVIKPASDAYVAKHADVKVDVQVSGTSGGFDKLCNGALDINMAVRGITDQEAAACAAKNVKYVETLLGFDASVLVVHSGSKITCISVDEAAKLLAPSAAGTVKNWNQVGTKQGDVPLGTLYAAQDSRARDLMATIVPGNALRNDISLSATAAEAIDKVVAAPDSVALVTYSDFQTAQGAQKTVRALDLKPSTTCISPTVANLEEARYPAGQPLYLYVNVASLDRPAVNDFLTYLLSSDTQSVVTSKGFILADDTTYTRDRNYITAKQAGRTFSRIQSVNVSPDTQGTVTVDGAPVAAPALKAVTDAFQPRYTKITVKTAAFGDDAGYRKLCAGSVDIIGATRPLTDAEMTACTNNKVQPLRLSLGANGVVLLVSNKNTFATCLTTAQIATLFGAASDGKVKKWSDVDAKFPATDLLLLTPAYGSNATDLLLLRTVKGVAPLRRHDTTENDDALYRAAGTANVDGAITYMTYTEFKKAKADIHAVQVDAGKGCVAPSDQTIADGTYPISQSVYIVLNTTAFARPEVKAFVWYLLSEDALTVLGDKNDLIGLDKAGFVTARDTALEKFAQTPATAAASGTPGGLTPLPTIGLGLNPVGPTTVGTSAATSVPSVAPTLTPAPAQQQTQIATPVATAAK